MKQICVLSSIGLAAGFVTGIFGGGGGMILVPLLTQFSGIREENIFPASVCVILPVCITSLLLSVGNSIPTWSQAAPYLTGSLLGGICAGTWGRKIPSLWLHRILGAFVLFGGIRCLCQTTS